MARWAIFVALLASTTLLVVSPQGSSGAPTERRCGKAVNRTSPELFAVDVRARWVGCTRARRVARRYVDEQRRQVPGWLCRGVTDTDRIACRRCRMRVSFALEAQGGFVD